MEPKGEGATHWSRSLGIIVGEEVETLDREGGSCSRNDCCCGMLSCKGGKEGAFWIVAGEEVAEAGTGFRLTGSLEGRADFNRLGEAVEATELLVEVGGIWSVLRGRPRSILLGSFLRSLCWRALSTSEN